MSWSIWRLWGAATVFLLWSVWLAWQVWLNPGPRLVSQPQLLAAPIIVVAEVQAAEAGKPQVAIVREVLKGEGFVPADRRIHILDWPSATGAQGPGDYLLALLPVDRPQARFQLVPVPVSPGFFYRQPLEVQRRVYPASESVRRQVEQLMRPDPPAKVDGPPN